MPHEQIPTTEPTELTAGTSWVWDRVVAGHSPADGWILRYAIRGKRNETFTADVNNDTFEVRRTPSQTELFPEGQYDLSGVLEMVDGGGAVTDRHVVYDGQLAINRNPLALVGPSWAERALAAVEAVIEGRADADEESFRIADREVTRIPIAELIRLRNKLRTEVAAKRGERALFGRYEVHFVRP